MLAVLRENQTAPFLGVVRVGRGALRRRLARPWGAIAFVDLRDRISAATDLHDTTAEGER